MSIDETPRGSVRPIHKRHYNSLPKTSLEPALGPVLRRAPQDERQDEPHALSRETIEMQIREGITVAMVEANGTEFPPLSAEDVEKAGIGPCLRILIDTLGIRPGYGVVIRREDPR